MNSKKRTHDKSSSNGWDLKSVLITIAVLGGVGILFLPFLIPGCDAGGRDGALYYAETMGTVYSLKAIESQSQGRLGSSTTFAYEIKYTYEINGKAYSGSDIIKYKPANAVFIGFAKANLNKQVFRVRYASRDPEKSILVSHIE